MSRRTLTIAIAQRVVVVAAIVVVTGNVSGCTQGNPVDTIAGSASSAAPTVASGDGSPIGEGPTSLLCSQSAHGTFPDSVSALAGRVRLDLLNTGASSAVPLARDVGLIVPGDRDWLFRKAPIAVAAGTDSVTVSVPDDGKQFLAWVPYRIWASGTSPNLTPWAQTSITIHPCSYRSVVFLGGVLALASDRCFTMRFRTESGLEDDRSIRLDGQACRQ